MRILSQTVIDDWDQSLVRVWWESMKQYYRYHKTIESQVSIHNKKCKHIKHYLESGTLIGHKEIEE